MKVTLDFPQFNKLAATDSQEQQENVQGIL